MSPRRHGQRGRPTRRDHATPLPAWHAGRVHRFGSQVSRAAAFLLAVGLCFELLLSVSSPGPSPEAAAAQGTSSTAGTALGQPGLSKSESADCHLTLDVPEQHPTIQAALDAASSGDEVRVAAGFYEEALVIRKPIRLTGESRRTTVLQCPKGASDVVQVLLDEGEVEIGGVSVVGSAANGIRVEVGRGADVVIRSTAVSANTVGINCAGPGHVTVEDSLLADNVSCGVSFGCASALCLGTEISGSDVGILLDVRSQPVVAQCTDNVVALGRMAVAVYSGPCGFSSEADAWPVQVTGQGNALQGREGDLCPPSGVGPWTSSFCVSGFSEAVGAVLEQLDQLRQMRSLSTGTYDDAERLLALGLGLLAEHPFPLLEARLLAEMGHLLTEERLGFSREAAGYLVKAGSILLEHGLLTQVADTDLAAGRAHLAYGRDRFGDALDALLRASRVYERQGTLAQVDEMQYWIGLAYVGLQRYAEALPTLQQVLGTDPAQIGAVNMAKLHQALGDSYRGLGRYDEALGAYEQGLQASDPEADGFSELYVKFSLRTADTYSRLGIHEEARLVLEDALAHTHAASCGPYPCPYPMPYPDRARCLVLLGAALLEQGQYEQALAAFTTEGCEWSFLMGSLVLDLAELYMYTGRAYLGMQDYGRAMASFDEARAIYEAQEMWESLASVDIYCGELYAELGLLEDALPFYRRALGLVDRVDPPPGMTYSCPDARWRLFFSLGKCRESQGKTGWADARLAYERAIAVIESMRSWLELEELKVAWQEETRAVYEHLIDLLNRSGDGTAAFSYVERCRARAFLDLLGRGPAETLENVEESGVRSGTVDSVQIEADIERVRASLPDDTVVLEYFSTETRTYVWVVRKAAVAAPIALLGGQSEIADEVIACRKRLEGFELGTDRDLAELYDRLVRPVEDLLPLPASRADRTAPHLIIIPSGPLYYIPFQALLWTSPDRSDSARLVERYAVSYAHSLASLNYAQRRVPEREEPPCFLGVADPSTASPRLPEAQVEAREAARAFACSQVYVDRDATEGVVQSQSRTANTLLLSTHGFFDATSPMFSYLVLDPAGESDGRLYTYEVFGLPLDRADLVVLSACETLLPGIEGMQQEVRGVRMRRAGRVVEEPPLPPFPPFPLADNPEAPPQAAVPADLSRELLAQLVTGDELVGLTRAFLAAGATSVLSTLWRVPSQATTELIVHFYEALRDGLDKAEALRCAELEVMGMRTSQVNYAHPTYWGAFNLVGGWQ